MVLDGEEDKTSRVGPEDGLIVSECLGGIVVLLGQLGGELHAGLFRSVKREFREKICSLVHSGSHLCCEK